MGGFLGFAPPKNPPDAGVGLGGETIGPDDSMSRDAMTSGSVCRLTDPFARMLSSVDVAIIKNRQK